MQKDFRPDSEISTHTPLAGRDEAGVRNPPDWEISTHTPLAGRDRDSIKQDRDSGISTHTPLAGRDPNFPSGSSGFPRFLLTRPSRDVTNGPYTIWDHDPISTHTPLAGRDCLYLLMSVAHTISTHTPLAGRDVQARDVRQRP